MKDEELKFLKELMGEGFRQDECERLLEEDPLLAHAASELSDLFRGLQNSPIPLLNDEFTSRVMERIQKPSWWFRLQEMFLSWKTLGWATAGAVAVLAGLYWGPRLFKNSTEREFPSPSAQAPFFEKIYQVRFTLKEPRATLVSLAGDFNRWNPIPLIQEQDGTFAVSLVLKEGTYSYAFLVDGKKWVADVTADRIIEDGFGNKNSVINL